MLDAHNAIKQDAFDVCIQSTDRNVSLSADISGRWVGELSTVAHWSTLLDGMIKEYTTVSYFNLLDIIATSTFEQLLQWMKKGKETKGCYVLGACAIMRPG